MFYITTLLCQNAHLTITSILSSDLTLTLIIFQYRNHRTQEVHHLCIVHRIEDRINVLHIN